ncbi:phospholipase D-like domain-containing protein [Georgenia faecalis]|uniref:Phosphatidylserine/phosphatidylglycerophosphate/ cardiolipin synthase family protein n=1 Tax=Georgenia faecalis TaxID=2483799 RepID=A0ABV9D816_9MICO|nr:phospholipase D-like domain-containing protein [Georgenia faecalis]
MPSDARPPIRLAVPRALLWAGAALLAAQATVVAALLTIDSLRKRREPPHGEFPRTEPATVTVAGSQVTTYTYGVDLYDAMLAAIRGAKHHVYFESYIWKGDDTGREFKEALVEAAARGVQVYVVYDAFANLVVAPSFLRFPESLHVLRFPIIRPGLLMLNPRQTGRDHRKVLVVDGETGFVGGYNIGSLYATQWRDTHLRVEGPAAWELESAFVVFWNEHRREHHPELPDGGARSWDARIQAARNSPSRLVFPIRGLYLDAIGRARERVLITQGYFIPDPEILAALLAAARRGADVRVLVPAVSNHVVADWLARGHYDQLLRGGVRLWLYQGAMVHAKTMTVDGRWATVGTTNIDRLSLTGNFEINLEIFDRDFAAHLEQVFATDLTNAHELTLEEWEQRSVLARVSERVLRPLAPLF